MSRLPATILAVLLARSAFGCQCGARPDARAVFPRARAVFTGRVIGRHPVVIRGSEISYPAGAHAPALWTIQRVDIAVTRVFKGDVGDVFHLSELGCCICEFPFEVGETYLVFAHPHHELPGRWMASFCWPTKPERFATRDFQFLGAPAKTFGPPRDRRTQAARITDAANAAAAYVLERSRRPLIDEDRRNVALWSAVTAALSVVVAGLLIRSRR